MPYVGHKRARPKSVWVHWSPWSFALYFTVVACNWWAFYSVQAWISLSSHHEAVVVRSPLELFSIRNGMIDDGQRHGTTDDDNNANHECSSFLASNNPCQPLSVAWSDWKGCMQRFLDSGGWLGSTEQRERQRDSGPFPDFLQRCKSHLPWTGSSSSNHTAVLLEFRALERQMRFSVDNIMGNLPIDWRIQIIGGPSTCKLALELFASEIAAGKVIITFLPYENVAQDQISAILTDKQGFYDKLVGDTWLFFQYDSAICSQQRHLLHTFLGRDYGWWGAPWDFWGRTPKMCGNGGFSLRKRRFIETILARSPWPDGLSEDMYFCHAAADLYNDLPAALRPAPMAEEIPFSVETIWHEAPFAVHKFWPHLHVSTPALATQIIEHCPEALGILPADLVTNQTVWRDIVCSAQVDRGAFDQATNITFDFDRVCVVERKDV